MSVLRIAELHASVEGREILRGVDLEVASGEVHALDGSQRVREVDAVARADGPRRLRGHERLGHHRRRRAARPAHPRARRHAGCSSPCSTRWSCPACRAVDLLTAAQLAHGRDAARVPELVAAEATRLGVAQQFLDRGLNVEFSGGEQKRAETLQLAVLQPAFAVLDEIDSGLDVDALRDVARRIEAMTTEDQLGVLAITHYARLLDELRADRVHVLMAGRVVASGGPELARKLEQTGYEGLAAELGVETLAVETPEREADPFADPGF